MTPLNTNGTWTLRIFRVRQTHQCDSALQAYLRHEQEAETNDNSGAYRPLVLWPEVQSKSFNDGPISFSSLASLNGGLFLDRQASDATGLRG